MSRAADFRSALELDEFVVAPSDPLDERIEVGVLVVGAGPAGLACAVRFGQLLEEHPDVAERLGDVPLAVVEKGKQAGSHLLSGAVITVLYIVGTLSVLLTIPREQVSGLQGIMQAMQTVTMKVGLPWLAPIVAALVTVNSLGGVGGWFAATARLPFVAGIDRFLPPAFGRLHPKWRTPYVALLVQAAIAGLFVFLGQAGTSVRGAYDALVSMGIIAYFIPFLFMFAAMIKVQKEAAGPDVIRVPGGPAWG